MLVMHLGSYEPPPCSKFGNSSTKPFEGCRYSRRAP